jgi:hypothetical protein
MSQGLSGQTTGKDIGRRSSEFLGKGQTQYPEGGKLSPYLKAELTFEIRLFAERRDLVPAIAVNGFPEHGLLLREGKIHKYLL